MVKIKRKAFDEFMSKDHTILEIDMDKSMILWNELFKEKLKVSRRTEHWDENYLKYIGYCLKDKRIHICIYAKSNFCYGSTHNEGKNIDIYKTYNKTVNECNYIIDIGDDIEITTDNGHLLRIIRGRKSILYHL